MRPNSKAQVDPPAHAELVQVCRDLDSLLEGVKRLPKKRPRRMTNTARWERILAKFYEIEYGYTTLPEVEKDIIHTVPKLSPSYKSRFVICLSAGFFDLLAHPAPGQKKAGLAHLTVCFQTLLSTIRLIAAAGREVPPELVEMSKPLQQLVAQYNPDEPYFVDAASTGAAQPRTDQRKAPASSTTPEK